MNKQDIIIFVQIIAGFSFAIGVVIGGNRFVKEFSAKYMGKEKENAEMKAMVVEFFTSVFFMLLGIGLVIFTIVFS